MVKSVRFSKLITILLSGGLMAQTGINIKVPELDWQTSAIDSTGIVTELDSLLDGNAGFNQQLVLDNLAIIQGQAQACYRRKSWNLKLDSLIFIGDSSVSIKTRNRLFAPLSGVQSSDQAAKAMKRLNGAYSFIDEGTSLVLGRYGEQGLAGVIDFQPDFASSFSGIVGLSRSADKGWLVTGELDLHLENAWQTAGIVDVNWQRKDELSQNIGLSIEEPFPFGLPLGIQGELEQELEDGLYVRLLTGLGFISNFSSLGRWQVGGQNIVVNPTDKGDSAGVEKNKSALIYATLSGDRRNERWLPSAGSYWKLYLAGGTNSGADTDGYLTRFSLDYQQYLPLGHKFVFHAHFMGTGYYTGSDSILVAEQVDFGGAGSLRGYPEAFFSANCVFIPQMELIYRANRNLQLLAFYDVGIQKAYDPWPGGYGFGIIQRTPGTVMEVSYGLAPDLKLNEGRIHVKISGKL